MQAYVEKYSRAEVDNKPLVLAYGTAGFRAKAEHMEHVVARMTLISALRSITSGNRVVGLCVTASHNPVADNGVKFIEADGKLPSIELERQAVELINSETPYESFQSLCLKVESAYHISVNSDAFKQACVLLGSDTRPSSKHLCEIIHEGLEMMQVHFYDFGYLTSPQLYFLVQFYNSSLVTGPSLQNFLQLNVFSIKNYFEWFSSRFLRFLEVWWNTPALDTNPQRLSLSEDVLVIDGANGPGGFQFMPFVKLLSFLRINVIRENIAETSEDVINANCGAELVKKKKIFPTRIEEIVKHRGPLKCCSFDGDADRVVYFTGPSNGSHLVQVLDGDRLLSLFVKLCCTLLEEMLDDPKKTAPATPLEIGIIQTGYANGASTEFIKSLISKVFAKDANRRQYVTFHVIRTRTGVKHLSNAAKKFHVAFFFESNGHGTVTADFIALERWSQEINLSTNRHFNILSCFFHLFERAEGDAMVNVLAVELALRFLAMNLQDWIEMYQDLYTCEASVHLPRNVPHTLIVDPNDETVLLKPTSLAQRLQNMIAECPKLCRAFVRPSGTENVWRIYVEASDQDTANMLVDNYEEELLKHLFTSPNQS